jgi:hypothetical protein
MSDWRIFNFKSSGNDVLIDVEQVDEVQAVYYSEDGEWEATLYMRDGRKIELCDFWDVVAARLQHGDDSPEIKKLIAAHKAEKARLAREEAAQRKRDLARSAARDAAAKGPTTSSRG